MAPPPCDHSAPADPSQRPDTLADLGEWELIRRLGAFAPPGQFGDDAALLAEPRPGAGPLVVNTDVLVEAIHFSDATTAPGDVGWRAAAANLSDLAAMGATKVLGITVALVAPASTPWSWVEGVYQGLGEALQQHGGTLLGGDCSTGQQRLLAVTALGRLPAEGGAIRRRDGRPGDLLLATGSHGLSRLGLALLQGTIALPPLPEALIQRAIRVHRRPVPRFDAVEALIACRPDGLPWRVGGCDSSDGLAAAVRAIALESGCGARLDRQALPLERTMAALPQATAWCLGGGEDFELVLAMDPCWARGLGAALPEARLIGALQQGAAGSLTWDDGTSLNGTTEQAGGYCHFRT